MQTKHANVP
uniref:Uncharacterized protein n=1 Tax=Anguilla anguilla TaxID=7936 RepID=A0A0E9P7H0_ANGAN